ncbi:MAG: DUF4215 domain-containing protein [Polyangiaceae bacterium]|nr:DUF4215 domain-containing protein [Polyangiaceae bacterium]
MAPCPCRRRTCRSSESDAPRSRTRSERERALRPARAGTEACDDGNASNLDECLVTCQFASCGDGFVHVGVEDCDDANGVAGDGCSPTCQSEGTGGAGGGGGATSAEQPSGSCYPTRWGTEVGPWTRRS